MVVSAGSSGRSEISNADHTIGHDGGEALGPSEQPFALGPGVVQDHAQGFRQSSTGIAVERQQRPSAPWSFCHAVITAPSLTQKTITSSTPAALRAAWCSKYPGICTEDQVGV